MRRFFSWFLLLLLVFSLGLPTVSRAEDWGSFVVEDEEETAPDPRRQAWALMQRMTDEQKIYQLFFVCPEDLTGEERTTALGSQNVFASRPVGGVMIFGHNIENEKQLMALTAALQRQATKAGLYPLFIGTDEEGGAVSRVANKLDYPLAPSPQEIGETGDEALALKTGREIAAYLTPLGFNICFAPPADTVIDKAQPGVQTYGQDPELVSRMASAMAEGLRESGIVPCYTHFPGHGAMEGTSLGNLSIRRTLDEMRALEWIPYRDAIENDIEMILVSHGLVRAVGDDIPASTSYPVISGILRGELGYDGLIITDSLRMAAVTSNYKTGQECVAALKAGADMLLLPPNLNAAVRAIQKALVSGDITMERIEESVERILAVKIRRAMVTGQ